MNNVERGIGNLHNSTISRNMQHEMTQEFDQSLGWARKHAKFDVASESAKRSTGTKNSEKEHGTKTMQKSIWYRGNAKFNAG